MSRYWCRRGLLSPVRYSHSCSCPRSGLKAIELTQLMPSNAERPKPGLRDRKKAKTRASIQTHALRLFREQGYHATTIEQIIEAADVSESTLFRYFPTKEDLVLQDDNDPMIIATFARKLQQLPPIPAIRAAFGEFFDSLTAPQRAEQRQRITLILSVPSLRARLLDQLFDATRQLAGAIAQHEQRTADDLAVRATAGAIIGTTFAVLTVIADQPDAEFTDLLDQALAHLQANFTT